MLFVDDYHVHSSQGVERVFHRLEQHPDNPIHVFTDPWGPICVDHGGYERDPQTGEFVLWYYTRPDNPRGMHESAFRLPSALPRRHPLGHALAGDTGVSRQP